ncbi:MAG TPA: hypothetical protein VEO53_17605 [Candidatus Binatia bacterium]|nr:hypothetical protein [Candidatus Binatia bacterium]
MKSPSSMNRREFLRQASLGVGTGLALTGRKIQWDPAKEVVVGDAEAAKLTTKEYRAPWKLPRV